ncbi:UNVERIFIED_CONTAM: photosystem II assembly protein [Euhalothece sp. KZN 001]
MSIVLRNIKQFVLWSAIALFTVSCSQVPSTESNPWRALENLPTEETMLDLAFTGDPNHGWMVGNQATLLETTDGGETWERKELELENEKLDFLSVSFVGEEGWIAGEPSVLLHTKDGGEHWSRIPLSKKLPGEPYSIIAKGEDTAEMTTNVGAIYETTNGGKNWQALVQEAVGVARNISRSPDGKYITVSARGNFYSTWTPGDQAWQAHERNTSRRVQNMGFTPDGRVWLLARGGQVQFTESEDFDSWQEPEYPEFSSSKGLLDIGYRTEDEFWVSGGSGDLFRYAQTKGVWEKDREMQNVPGNFYRVKFFSPEKGFILGDRGTVLKYEATNQAA